jgi:hypothetical protein
VSSGQVIWLPGAKRRALLVDFLFPSTQAAAMVRKVIERLVDDIDGSDATQSVSFGLDGVTYHIDLNEVHADELRTALGPYIDVARRVRDEQGRRRAGVIRRPVVDRDRNARIRQWALKQGVELPGRGRIARALVQAYDTGDVAALYAAAGLEMQPEQPTPKRSRRRGANAEPSTGE